MKQIAFNSTEKSTAVMDDTKVSAQFVDQLHEAFRMFPPRADMRFKQRNGKLIIAVTVTYEGGMTEHLEGAGDADLISAILHAMGKNLRGFSDYKAEEHEVEVAKEGENLVLEAFKQYMGSTMSCYLESDWFYRGERYRRIRFTPSFNKNVKFCLKATEEVDHLINEARKPQWRKQAEASETAN